jgi:hypothetical protein
MSDLSGVNPSSILSTSSELATGSAIDVSRVDKNLRTIKAVEEGWRLPALDDETRLDLASAQGTDEDSLAQFLSGLDRDVHGEADDEVIAPIQTGLTAPGYQPNSRSFMDEAKVQFAGFSGSPPPTEIDVDAVQEWKMRAIEKGYLPEPDNGVVDNSWSPEFQTIKRQMAYDEFNSSMRGDRPGAVPFSKALETLNKWTSPTGLLSAATELDLFWDVGAISKEFSSWGDKWRKVGKSKGVLDFGKNLVDALTGPIDDLVVPALNLGLLFTGVGNVTNFARIAYMGEKALVGGETVAGLYKAGKFGKAMSILKAGDVAADVERFTEASSVAMRLSNADNAVANTIGKGLSGWRGNASVAVTKKTVQQGMRLGIAQQLEDALPGYNSNGASISDLAGVSNATDILKNNFVLSGAAEAMFTPFTVFERGTFGVLKDAAKGALTNSVHAGTVIGAAGGAAAGYVAGDGDVRDIAAGAIVGGVAGASAPTLLGRLEKTGLKVGHVSDFLDRTSFKPIAQHEYASLAVHKGMLAGLADKPDQLARYKKDFEEHGFLKAFSNHLGTDEEAAGAAMGYVLTAAAIDHTAALQAGERGSKGWFDRYHTARNKLTAQLRGFDPEMDIVQQRTELAWAMVRKQGVDQKRAVKEFNRIRNSLKNEDLPALMELHNRVANETLTQLLSGENLPDLQNAVLGQGAAFADPATEAISAGQANIAPWLQLGAERQAGVLEAYLPQVIDHFGNWPKFHQMTGEIREATIGGLFDNATWKPAKNVFGEDMSLLPEVDKAREMAKTGNKLIPGEDEAWTEAVDRKLTDHFLGNESIDEYARKARYAPTAKAVDPGQGRFNVARKDTITVERGSSTWICRPASTP